MNPYKPSVHATIKKPTVRLPVVCTAILSFGASLAAGGGVAIACRLVGASGNDITSLLVFFLSLASVFGGVGAYLGCRYIQGRAPMWAIAGSLGALAIVLPPVFYPNTAPAISWIVAGLAAVSALISTTIAGIASSMAKPGRQGSPASPGD